MITPLRALSGLAVCLCFLVQTVMAQTDSNIPHAAPERYLETGNESLPLIRLDAGFDIDHAVSSDVVATLDPDDPAGPSLRLDVTPETNQYPGVTFHAPDGLWDLTEWQFINIDVENVGEHRLFLGLRADNPGADDDDSKRTFNLDEIAPGETKTIVLRLYATDWALQPPLKLVGMRMVPGEARIDPSRVEKIILFSVRPEHKESFIIRNIRAENRVRVVDSSTFLPFIDRYGQMMHRDWPNKVKSDDDLARHLEIEQQDLASHPGPESFNRYGGWADGPQLKATGSFYVTKHNGQWWFVDPEGKLFWSLGVDCVAPWFDYTGVEYRENYFAWLPDDDDPLAEHYSVNATWAPFGFYHDKLPFKTYNFFNANLHRKYGDNWRDAFADIAHKRLRSWGLNTLASWASPDVYKLHRTAYTTHVWIEGARMLEGSTGYWGQFPDVFDPGYRKAVRDSIAKREFEATDPWNIGYYIDNEKAWGNDVTTLPLATLASPADQPAKIAFIDDLKTFHRNIDALNHAWGTDYESWEDLLQRTDPPSDVNRARPDLERFYIRICETYFRTVKEELKAVAPDKLYLGVRFAWRNPTVVKLSSLYCDVVSFNVYKYQVDDLKLPDGIDRPILIGEFSFGAPDASPFLTTNVKAINQEHRGRLYQRYVTGALRHPQIVGAHWFQYVDQPASGRPDGENFNVGMVAITDTPHFGLIKGVRATAYRLYQTRAQAAQPRP